MPRKDAVLWAKKLKIDTVVNLSNTDFVFDKDPKKFKSAKSLKCLSWKEYRKLISDKWSAGLSTPFDPVASKEAQKSKIRVFIINGKRLGEVAKALSGKSFVGTVIQ